MRIEYKCCICKKLFPESLIVKVISSTTPMGMGAASEEVHYYCKDCFEK